MVKGKLFDHESRWVNFTRGLFLAVLIVFLLVSVSLGFSLVFHIWKGIV